MPRPHRPPRHVRSRSRSPSHTAVSAQRSARPALIASALLAAALASGGTPSARAATDLASAPLDALLDLEISGASKFSLRASEAPSSVTVIGADEIRALGYRTLADALQSVRGLVVSSDRTYHYLGVRGLATPGDYNTRILLLIDGNRVNDTVYEQAFLGTDFPVDIDLIERIEFIPGQGSAVHGGNALFGTVNVVTRAPDSAGRSEVATTFGSGRLAQWRVSTSQALGTSGARVLLSATTRRQSGRDIYYAAFDNPATNNGISHRTDHERNEQFFLKYVHGAFEGTLLHGDRTRGLSAYPDTVFNDPTSRYRDTQTLANLAWSHRLNPANLWKLRLYGGNYAFRGDFLYDVPPVTVNQDRALARWWGAETQLLSQQIERHKIVVGLDLQRSPHVDQSNADISPAALSYLDDRRSSARQSVFAEDQWSWSPRLAVTAGMRWDRIDNNTDTTQFSPRVAVVAQAAPNLVAKLIYGTGFRPANAYESYYAVSGTAGYKGNPALRHETVQGSELALEYRPSTATRLSASAYTTRARDLLVQSVDPADNQLVFNNVGALRTQGIELEAERIWAGGLHLRTNYSHQRATDTSGHQLDERSPRHLAKAALIVPLAEGWTLGSQSVLVSRRGPVAGHGVTHLTLRRYWSARRAEISLSVLDLFDRQPDDPGSDSVRQPVAPQDGRTWQARFTLGF